MNRTVVLVQIHPNRVEVVEISAETKARASALEGLRFRASRRVLVVRPLLADAGVRSKPVNRYLAKRPRLSRQPRFCVLSPGARRSKFCATCTS